MRTQVMHETVVGAPWLERESPEGQVEKTVLSTLPFKIGRNDTADLHIDSSQVSREHAIITRHGKKFQVKDLGSTNGTFLNGEQIEEATLNDGDLLAIAEVEFTFVSGAPDEVRQSATQVMQPSAASPAAHRDGVWDTILALRKTHEVVTQHAVRVFFQPIVDLATGEAFGYEALGASGAKGSAQPRCETLAPAVDCRATDRMRQLFRRLAAEESQSLPPGARLFVAITAAESAQSWLVDHLCRLRDMLGGNRKLVVEIPDSAVRITEDFQALRAVLRDAQIELAYDGFASGKAHITEREDVLGDFLKLAPSTLRSVHRGEDRQRQVQLIMRACRDIGCAVIVTGIDSEADLRVCRDLGCGLAQGEVLGRAQPLSDIVHASRSPVRAESLTK